MPSTSSSHISFRFQLRYNFKNTNNSYAWYLPCQLNFFLFPHFYLLSTLFLVSSHCVSSSCFGLSKKKNIQRAKKKKKKFCTFWFASAYICLGLINFLWVQRSEFIIYFISLKRVDNRFFFAFLFASQATCCSCCCRFARAAFFFVVREKLTIEVNDNRFGSALSHFVNEKKRKKN